MHDEARNDVSSGPSFGHDDPVFAKEIQLTRWPSATIGSQHIYEVRPRRDHRGAGQKNGHGEITT
jgi:hypothetical protein